MATAVGSTIGALRVVIGADTTGLQRGLKETQSGMDGVGRSAASAAKRVAAMGAAFTAAAGAIAYLVRGEANLIASQAKLARSINGTITGLRTLNMAAADNGIEGMDAALNRMNRRLGAAAMGTGPAIAAVEALGLNLKEINEMDVDEKLALVADRIKESGMSSQEAARHLQNLGFQQAEAATFFMQGGDAIRAARQEVERYGLAVDEASAAKLEDITTQWTRISTALAGVRTQLTLALLPALESIGNLVESAAQALARLTPYISRIATLFGHVAEAVGVAGLALAGFYAPTVLAGISAATGGIAAFTTAVGVGAVGAVRALTAAMLANPIGAITAALVAAGYAAYKFRDQINEAIGVDVVAIAKNAANTVINSFVAAYEDIKFVWNNFGDMMGGAVVGGINVAIRAINRLIEGALSGINSLVDAVNKIPGVDIGKIGESAKIDLLNNEYSARLVDAVKERNAKIAEIMSTDRFASAPGGMVLTDTPSISGSPSGESSGVAEGAGGASGGAAAKENDQLQQRLDNLRDFLATREELEVQAGIDRVDLIGEALTAGLISEQEHNQMLYDVAGKFYDSMAALRDEKYQEQRDKLAELNELDIISDEEYHAQKMELLARQEQEKTDALIEAYLQRKEMLDEMVAEGDISDEEHKLLMEELEEGHQDALTRLVAQGAQARKKLDEDEAKARSAVMSGMMSNLTQLMNSGNKEMFRIGKIAAIAQSLLAGREAVVSSYKVGARIGGPALGAAFAATAAAATAAQIASVKNTSFGGGGGVSSSGGGGSYGRPTDNISNNPLPEPAAEAPKHSKVTINLQGEVFGRQQVRDLIEKINEATADGAQLRLE